MRIHFVFRSERVLLYKRMKSIIIKNKYSENRLENGSSFLTLILMSTINYF
jgi:hypothetical protein